MGVISTVLGFSGFGFGFSAGIVIGYFLFIYVQPNDVKVYVTEEQELIMEPSLKWAANPNVTVVVKAYGRKT
nr:unnamed protein product [Digitaria exilis]